LTRGEVAGVFQQAQLPVPLLALNHPDGRQLPAGDVSEFGLLPETEGAQAADHMVERGIRRAYVVISNDDFARRAASAFKAELAARGGELSGMATLPSASNSYADAINGMKVSDSHSISPDTGAQTVSDESGIFISMRPEQARLLIPQLRIAGITIPVVATSHVYSGKDDVTANSDLNGVEFSDAPWLFNAQPGLPSHDDIAARLPAASGTSARLFAFGMDAWNLVPYLDWLRAHPGSYLPGASGQLTADQFGRIRRVLTWAKFQNGLAQPIGGSLQMDDVPAVAPPINTMPPETDVPATDNSQPGND
jgi:outer membrane PBP1 activator LpoA protein